MGAHGCVALLACTAALAVPVSPASAEYTASDEIAALTQLDGLVNGKSHLSPAQRQDVHDQTEALIMAGGYTALVQGVSYADVLSNLACVGAALQHARNAARSNKPLELKWANIALGCQRTLADAMKAGGQASPRAASDISSIGAQIKVILGRIRARHVFGAKSTDLRRFIAEVVIRRDFTGPPVFGEPFSAHFYALECVEVKVEAGRFSGASACIHRLRRLLRRHVPGAT